MGPDPRGTIILVFSESISSKMGGGIMLNKNILVFTVITLSLFGLFGCSINRTQGTTVNPSAVESKQSNDTITQKTLTEEDKIKQTIEGYHAKSYDMWFSLKMGDLSQYLDLESVQSYNKIIVLEESIEMWKYAIEKGYVSEEAKAIRKKHGLYYKYNSIKIAGDNAEVKVVVSGETSGTPVYPMVIRLGENIFKLRRVGDSWLIYEHDYIGEGGLLYERSKTEKLELDIEKLRQAVDRDHQ